MALPVTPIPAEPKDAPKGVLVYIRQLNQFLKELLAHVSGQATMPQVRAGIGQIDKSKMETLVHLDPPLKKAYVVVVTEWRNQPSNAFTPLSIYVERTEQDSFTVGHHPYVESGDPPSFAWIATEVTDL